MTPGPGSSELLDFDPAPPPLPWRWIRPGRELRSAVFECSLCGLEITVEEGYWVAAQGVGRPASRRHAECHDPEGRE